MAKGRSIVDKRLELAHHAQNVANVQSAAQKAADAFIAKHGGVAQARKIAQNARALEEFARARGVQASHMRRHL